MRRLNPIATYTTSRLLLFLVCAVALSFLGMHGVLLLLVALIVSGLLSYVLLSGQRDAMSAAVVARAQRREESGQPPRSRGLRRLFERIDERARAEDLADDAAREAGEEPKD